jgi:hypothetical protein
MHKTGLAAASFALAVTIEELDMGLSLLAFDAPDAAILAFELPRPMSL